jgi:hypothetical protein
MDRHPPGNSIFIFTTNLTNFYSAVIRIRVGQRSFEDSKTTNTRDFAIHPHYLWIFMVKFFSFRIGLCGSWLKIDFRGHPRFSLFTFLFSLL